jgi:hypothetical protein
MTSLKTYLLQSKSALLHFRKTLNVASIVTIAGQKLRKLTASNLSNINKLEADFRKELEKVETITGTATTDMDYDTLYVNYLQHKHSIPRELASDIHYKVITLEETKNQYPEYFI